MDSERIKLDEKASKALDAKWDALEKAKDGVLFAQSDFESLAYKTHKAKGTSPRHWSVAKGPDAWYLFKPDNPPDPRGEE